MKYKVTKNCRWAIPNKPGLPQKSFKKENVVDSEDLPEDLLNEMIEAGHLKKADGKEEKLDKTEEKKDKLSNVDREDKVMDASPKRGRPKSK